MVIEKAKRLVEHGRDVVVADKRTFPAMDACELCRRRRTAA